MTDNAMKSPLVGALTLLLGLSLLAGCGREQAQERSVFSYDQGKFLAAKPWTNENFKNNPNNF